MTTDELDELDRVCAEAMGWSKSLAHNYMTGERETVWVHEDRTWSTAPSPTRNPADFVALLKWHAKGERAPEVHYGLATGLWVASLYEDKSGVVAKERSPCPMVALALETAAWHKGNGGEK